MATLPVFRRRGLASALLARIQGEASGPLFLFTVTDEAERLYRRAGFRYLGFWQETSFWLP